MMRAAHIRYPTMYQNWFHKSVWEAHDFTGYGETQAPSAKRTSGAKAPAAVQSVYGTNKFVPFPIVLLRDFFSSLFSRAAKNCMDAGLQPLRRIPLILGTI
jgi:hypothetical protein